MKKVLSIAAVALFSLGLATEVITNTAKEFDFIDDIENLIACAGCSKTEDYRGGRTRES